MMIVARAIIALGMAAGLGTLLDRVLRFAPRSPARWAIRVLSALVLLHSFQVLPAVLAVVLVAGLLTRPARALREQRAAPRSEQVAAWAGVAVLTALTVLRSPTTLYWDEMVWLAKARLEATSPGALTIEALRLGTSTVPPGYPLFEPIAVSALAGYSPHTTSLVIGAELLTIVAGAAFVLTALRGQRHLSGRDATVAALATACPLVLVHLRSAYVDLELGMLAATLLLLLEAREIRAAAVVTMALVAMKDEGIAHLVAISAAAIVVALARGQKREARSALLVAILGAACFAAWRARLASSHVTDADHALGLPSFARLPDVLRFALVQGTDMLAWGCLWAAVAGVAVAAVVRPASVDGLTRSRLLALAAQASLLIGAILCSPERVMEFVHAGTLLPRLLVQLAPSAMLVLAAGLAQGAPFLRRG